MSAKDFREVFIGEVQVTKILEAETFYLVNTPFLFAVSVQLCIGS
jgi:hypothetical protein